VTGRSARRLLVGLLLPAVAACGVPQDELPRALTPAEVPYASAAASAVPDAAGNRVAELFLVRDGQVVPTPRKVDGPLPTEGLVELLLGGTTQEERDAGLISVIPSTLDVADVQVQGSTAVLTLEGPDAEVQRTSPLAYAQIVATLSPARVTGVRFRLDGRDLDVPRGDGSLSNGPLSREDFAELLEPPPASAASPSA
jgi:hypothetical protein